MTRSEVYNCDCIEYMRTLPDGHFDIAVCDPPYGKGNDDTTSRFTTSGKFRRYFATKETDCVPSPPLIVAKVGTDSKAVGESVITTPPPRTRRESRKGNITISRRNVVKGILPPTARWNGRTSRRMQSRGESPNMGYCSTARVL